MQFTQPLAGQCLDEMDKLLTLISSVTLVPDQVDMIK
jgi:hypothetical protein